MSETTIRPADDAVRFRPARSSPDTALCWIVGAIFVALIVGTAFENRTAYLRQAQLEMGVGQVVRSLRQGPSTTIDNDALRHAICASARLGGHCLQRLVIGLDRLDLAGPPSASVRPSCFEHRGEATTLGPSGDGGRGSVLVVEACLVTDRFLPTSGWLTHFDRRGDRLAIRAHGALAITGDPR